MKIKLINHNQTELNHKIEVRVEQECEPFNSINQEVTLSKVDTSHLLDDEVYTFAYLKLIVKAIKVFKKVGYKEEKNNPIEFKLIPSKYSSIKLDLPSEIVSSKGKTEELPCGVIILDQYGNYFKDGSVTLAAEYPNVSLSNNMLSIGDYTGEIKLESSYYSLKESITINVTQFTKLVTDEEKAIDLVKYLMNDSEFLNSVGIAVRT